MLGLSWFSIVAGRGDPGAAARRRARAAGANCYLLALAQPCVGATRLASALWWQSMLGGRTAPPLHAAAWLAASLTSDRTAFFALRVPGIERLWVCAVADGLPLNGFDLLVDSSDVPILVERLLQRRGISPGQCTLHGDAEGLPWRAQALSWASVAAQAPNLPESRLHAIIPTPWLALRSEPADRPARPPAIRSSSTWPTLPERGSATRRLLLCGGVLGLPAAIWALTTDSRESPSEAVLPPAPAAAQTEPDAAVDVLARWAADRPAPGHALLQPLRDVLLAMPTRVAGWHLGEVACRLSASTWRCTAAFERSPVASPEATTRALLAALPRKWSANPRSLDRVDATFEIGLAQPTAPMRPLALQPVAWHRIHTASALQEMQRALMRVQWSDFASLTPATATSTRAQTSTPAPVADATAPVMSSVVQLSGPLRSIELPQLADLQVSWNTLVVQLAHAASQVPDLRTSALVMQLSGEVHATP